MARLPCGSARAFRSPSAVGRGDRYGMRAARARSRSASARHLLLRNRSDSARCRHVASSAFPDLLLKSDWRTNRWWSRRRDLASLTSRSIASGVGASHRDGQYRPSCRRSSRYSSRQAAFQPPCGPAGHACGGAGGQAGQERPGLPADPVVALADLHDGAAERRDPDDRVERGGLVADQQLQCPAGGGGVVVGPGLAEVAPDVGQQQAGVPAPLSRGDRLHVGVDNCPQCRWLPGGLPGGGLQGRREVAAVPHEAEDGDERAVVFPGPFHARDELAH